MATGEDTAKASGSDEASPSAVVQSKVREWDPASANQALKITTNPWTDGVLLEFMLIAFDAAHGQIYGQGTRRHIKNAFRAGATVEEIMEVLKLGVEQGVQACNVGVTILAEELERDAASKHAAP